MENTIHFCLKIWGVKPLLCYCKSASQQKEMGCQQKEMGYKGGQNDACILQTVVCQKAPVGLKQRWTVKKSRRVNLWDIS